MLGSVEDIRERLARLQEEVGVTEFICQFNFGGISPELVRRSMRRFAEEIMPAFK